MAAYLIVDVDDLLQRFTSKGISLDLQELAVGLRGGELPWRSGTSLARAS